MHRWATNLLVFFTEYNKWSKKSDICHVENLVTFHSNNLLRVFCIFSTTIWFSRCFLCTVDFGLARDVYETDYYRKGGKGMLGVILK